MSRHRGKKEKKPDPNRQKRIEEMLQKEKEIRDLIESTNRMAKDLSHHSHYDKIQKERATTISTLAPEIKTLFESSLDHRAQCIFAESHLEQKCEMLQEELDTLQGRLPETHSSDDNSLINTLPPAQANALRFVRQLNKMRASKISLLDVQNLVKRFTELLDTIEPKLWAFREAANDLLFVFQKKIERGWMSTTDIEPYKPHLENGTEGLPEAIAQHRTFLKDWIERCETLSSRIRNLEQEIDHLRRKK